MTFPSLNMTESHATKSICPSSCSPASSDVALYFCWCWLTNASFPLSASFTSIHVLRLSLGVICSKKLNLILKPTQVDPSGSRSITCMSFHSTHHSILLNVYLFVSLLSPNKKFLKVKVIFILCILAFKMLLLYVCTK